MPFVIDASLTACWVLPDENHPHAAMALARIKADQALAPGIWWYEVRNTLIVNERRKRISESDTAGILQDLQELQIKIDEKPVRLARTHRLSFYDASYLELALRERALLASLDTALNNAARAECVPLIGEPETSYQI